MVRVQCPVQVSLFFGYTNGAWVYVLRGASAAAASGFLHCHVAAKQDYQGGHWGRMKACRAVLVLSPPVPRNNCRAREGHTTRQTPTVPIVILVLVDFNNVAAIC